MKEDGSQEADYSKVRPVFDRVLESTLYIVDYLNKQDEPFDGIAAFSQGVYQMQMLFKCNQYFSKDLNLRHPLPYFVVDFNGPKWDAITYEFLRS